MGRIADITPELSERLEPLVCQILVALYELGGAADAPGVMRQIADYRHEAVVSAQLAETLSIAFARHVSDTPLPYLVRQPGTADRWALSDEGWSLFRR